MSQPSSNRGTDKQSSSFKPSRTPPNYRRKTTEDCPFCKNKKALETYATSSTHNSSCYNLNLYGPLTPYSSNFSRTYQRNISSRPRLRASKLVRNSNHDQSFCPAVVHLGIPCCQLRQVNKQTIDSNDKDYVKEKVDKILKPWVTTMAKVVPKYLSEALDVSSKYCVCKKTAQSKIKFDLQNTYKDFQRDLEDDENVEENYTNSTSKKIGRNIVCQQGSRRLINSDNSKEESLNVIEFDRTI